MNTISGPHWTVYCGDCRAAMQEMAPRSVHCVVTSPPYWGGVRDYKIPGVTWGDRWEGCYGNEPTIEAYIAHTIEIFEGFARVLRDDGVIWWNIGDTFVTGAGKAKIAGGGDQGERWTGQDQQPNRMPQEVGAGNKSLVPHRVAIALQESGWIVRQDVIWRKPSPMPESVGGIQWDRCRRKTGRRVVSHQGGMSSWNMSPEGGHGNAQGGEWREQEKTVAEWEPCPGCDKCRDNGGYRLRRASWRPSVSHEYIFMITKPGPYYADAIAAQEQAVGATPGNKSHSYTQLGNDIGAGRKAHGLINYVAVETRNPRSVWSFSNEPFKGQHFAAFPCELPWKCIQASTSKEGCCPACGSQYAPVVERERVPTRPGTDSKVWKQDLAGPGDGQYSTASPNRDPQRHIVLRQASEYRPTCDCDAGEPVPPVIFDPFTGSGTTLQVAINTGRDFIGCEMADHYLPLIEERARVPWTPKAERRNNGKKRHESHPDQLNLFT